MAGLVLDTLVIGAIRAVRTARRRSQALRWPIADGKLTRFTTTSVWPTLPLLDYEYQVDAHTYDGSATGFSIKDSQISVIGDKVDSLQGVRIRYDPVNPANSRLLNEDNPEIPFGIDLLAH